MHRYNIMCIVHSNAIMCRCTDQLVMAAPYNVKARVHHGSESLDLTIPAELKREQEISAGDVFLVDTEEEGGDLVLKYKRIHQSE